MAKKFKLKYLIIAFVIIAIITACTAFSVSYAAWVSPNKNLTASVGTGKWDNNKTAETIKWPDGNDVISVSYNGENYFVKLKEGTGNEGDFWNYSEEQFQFEISVKSGQEVFFKLGSYLIYYKDAEDYKVQKYNIFGKDYYFARDYDGWNPDTNNDDWYPNKIIYAPQGSSEETAEIIANPITGSFKFNKDGNYAIYIHYKDGDASNNYISISRLDNKSDKTIDLSQPK